ncbi:YslB family protein [Virgibacillus sp. YIM 98842]|jgi:predicted hydrocarbon binding protein|uniref:YslB family protein n=1 Tax=Virgibacillus sp. YIM 98842 TaxID=2663533 RepID=UPI0013DA9A52|nr:YslB family protein [Virgibacillus sp. YIM 98842]
MSKENKVAISQLDELNTNGAGYDVLRYVGLPELLGNEADALLYFMGRNIARKLDIAEMDDILNCFDKLGWGKLELVKQKKNQMVFHLMSDAVVYRLKSELNTEFRLEAGFLAEAIQSIQNMECECTEEINTRIYQVQFNVYYSK